MLGRQALDREALLCRFGEVACVCDGFCVCLFIPKLMVFFVMFLYGDFVWATVATADEQNINVAD
jgi:hypothetical protein